MRFTYLYREGTKACEQEPLTVAMDGVPIGKIHKLGDNAYQMVPNGWKMRPGPVLASVTAVQASLPDMFSFQPY